MKNFTLYFGQKINLSLVSVISVVSVVRRLPFCSEVIIPSKNPTCNFRKVCYSKQVSQRRVLQDRYQRTLVNLVDRQCFIARSKYVVDRRSDQLIQQDRWRQYERSVIAGF